jgi:hypothetical protein
MQTRLPTKGEAGMKAKDTSLLSTNRHWSFEGMCGWSGVMGESAFLMACYNRETGKWMCALNEPLSSPNREYAHVILLAFLTTSKLHGILCRSQYSWRPPPLKINEGKDSSSRSSVYCDADISALNCDKNILEK